MGKPRGTADLLVASDAAEFLGIPPHRIYPLVEGGRLPRVYRPGYKRGFYRRSDLIALRAELEAEARALAAHESRDSEAEAT